MTTGPAVGWVVERWVPGEPKPEAPRRRNGEPNRGPGHWSFWGAFNTRENARSQAATVHGRTRVRRIGSNIRY